MYTYASSPKFSVNSSKHTLRLTCFGRPKRMNPNPIAGDVSRVSLHVWESFMEKTGTGDPEGNNIHRELDADGSVLREEPGYPMTHPWDWYIYLHEWQIFMVNVGKYIPDGVLVKDYL